MFEFLKKNPAKRGKENEMKTTMTELNSIKTPFRKQIAWMLKNPPEAPVKMLIAPEMASEMLEYNTRNRPVRESRVKDLARRMESGQWKLISTAISFDKSGRLTNGQHRLQAVVKSGVPCEFFVVFGLDEDSFMDEDQHGVRSASDIFQINGVKDPALTSCAATWVYRYEMMGMGRGTPETRPTKEDLYEFYLGHQGLADSRKYGVRFSKGSLASPSLMVALHYLCSKKNQAQADQFFTKIATGVGITSTTDPAHKLREFLLDNRVGHKRANSDAIAAFTVQAWNAMREGRRINIFRWRGEQNPNQAFPRIK